MSRLPLFFGAGILTILVGCAATPEEAVGASEDALTINPGVVVGTVGEGSPWNGDSQGNDRVAVSFEATAGDTVDIWVRATPYTVYSPNDDPGDAVAWLVRPNGKVITWNNNGSPTTYDAHLTATLTAGTYYVAVRDKQFRYRPFEVSLQIACGAPNTIKTVPCGAGGTMESICVTDLDGTNRWSNFSACMNEIPGGCIPGMTATEHCGTCGTRMKACTASFTWNVGSCLQPANACSPGTIGTTSAGCLPGTFRHRTCSSSCLWGSFETVCTP